MRKEYDFSNARRNPYARKLKRQVTIRLDESTIRYFHKLASETGIAYQTLINLYLRECAGSGKRLALNWMSVRERRAAYGRNLKRSVREGPVKRRGAAKR